MQIIVINPTKIAFFVILWYNIEQNETSITYQGILKKLWVK